MAFLIKIRNLIIFLKMFYWFPFKVWIIGIIRGTFNLHYAWPKSVFDYLRIRLEEIPQEQMSEESIILLVNHRSQADFFIHNILTGTQMNFLARWAVCLVFPMCFGVLKTVWFFRRSGKINVQKFNRWLDSKFKNSPRPSLLVYPEGHRMYDTITVQPNQLKTGMIKYAYSRNKKVQFLISFGNENIFNEKNLHISWGQTVYFSFSQIYNPYSYETQQMFVEEIRNKFCEFFDKIYHNYTQKLNILNQDI